MYARILAQVVELKRQKINRDSIILNLPPQNHYSLLKSCFVCSIQSASHMSLTAQKLTPGMDSDVREKETIK